MWVVLWTDWSWLIRMHRKCFRKPYLCSDTAPPCVRLWRRWRSRSTRSTCAPSAARRTWSERLSASGSAARRTAGSRWREAPGTIPPRLPLQSGDWIISVLRIRDVHPGSWFLFIPDLGFRIHKKATKRWVKKFVVLPFFVATNITKLKIILFWTEILGNLQIKLSKTYTVGIRDPEKKPIPDLGSEGPRVRIRNTRLFLRLFLKFCGSGTARSGFDTDYRYFIY